MHAPDPYGPFFVQNAVYISRAKMVPTVPKLVAFYQRNDMSPHFPNVHTTLRQPNGTLGAHGLTV